MSKWKMYFQITQKIQFSIPKVILCTLYTCNLYCPKSYDFGKPCLSHQDILNHKNMLKEYVLREKNSHAKRRKKKNYTKLYN